MPQRVEQLTRWLQRDLGLPAFELVPASADASFRRYFRVHFAGESRIAMDAPPEREDIESFVRVGRALQEAGLNVPEIHAENAGEGFLLLSDLGERDYLSVLDEHNVERLYGDALGALVALQACGPRAELLPPFSRELLLKEMALFSEWFLGRHLALELSDTERAMLAATFTLLADAAMAQPQVPVHRDYHSRNLMVCEHNPGILDFQDAVLGPVTYDLVSLLRDAYVAWPGDRVTEWVLGYHDLAFDSGVLRERDEARFLRWFELMGAQRHLKVLGIFCRLNYRDGKPRYLGDLPLTLAHLRGEAARQPELADLHDFLEARVVPRIGDASA